VGEFCVLANGPVIAWQVAAVSIKLEADDVKFLEELYKPHAVSM